MDNGQLTMDNGQWTMRLNEIGRVVFTTGKELFFDPYQKNKQTGAFILIDPITNNTSAVGMIINELTIDNGQSGELTIDNGQWTMERTDNCQSSIVHCQLNPSALGIGKEHDEAIDKICKELEKQGIKIEIIK